MKDVGCRNRVCMLRSLYLIKYKITVPHQILWTLPWVINYGPKSMSTTKNSCLTNFFQLLFCLRKCCYSKTVVVAFSCRVWPQSYLSPLCPSTIKSSTRTSRWTEWPRPSIYSQKYVTRDGSRTHPWCYSSTKAIFSGWVLFCVRVYTVA